MVRAAADTGQGGIELAFRLPLDGWPRALFRSDYGYGGARLQIDGEQVLRADSRDELERGIEGSWDANGAPLSMRLQDRGGVSVVQVLVAGREAVREDKVWAKPSRSAWIHAVIALLGSAAGFTASGFYLRKADSLQSDWALRMGLHTAGWHLLLTLTLFPASVWGQRVGIRIVQAVSLVFFFIHAGIALANSDLGDPGIAAFNALSGALFLASAIYGNRAYRDMDPIAALRAGRF